MNAIAQPVTMAAGPWREGAAAEASPDFVVAPPSARALGGEPFSVAREAPAVDFLLYPDLRNPFNENPWNWSLWGHGCLAPDGCHYSAVGDHDGPNGEVLFFQYDPARRAIRRVFSFQALVGHRAGDWGFGKLHGRLDPDGDGWIYFAGYWGKPRDENGVETQISRRLSRAGLDILELLRESDLGPNLSERYPGGVIARYHVGRHEAESLGAPVPGFSWPMHAADLRRGLLYLLGTDNSFACFDLGARALRYHGSQDLQYGMRGLLVDAERGLAYFSADDGRGPRLACFDPSTNAVRLTEAILPAGPGSHPDAGEGFETDPTIERVTAPHRPSLRAAAPRRARDGAFYAVTAHEGGPRLFRFDAGKERIEDLGYNLGRGYYTTSLALSPGGRYLYFVPSAHGTSWKLGAPVVQYDTETRSRKVLAFLDPVFGPRHDYRFGGTFGVDVSPDGSTLYIPLNGNRTGATKSRKRDQAFGLPSLLAVHVPASERRE